MNLLNYEADRWHWIVGEDEDRAWSSVAGAYVSTADQTYLDWIEAGGLPTLIGTEEELCRVLRQAGLTAFPIALVEDVKAEAARRIEAIMPDYKQRNVMAWGLETMMIYGADPTGWPSDLQAVNNQAQAAWAAIKAIRTRSDEIEAMDPIPADFREDAYWLA